MFIREEGLRDPPAIHAVHLAAFGREDEGRLVDRLRQDGKVVASLVAVEDRKVVGHVLFSDLRIETQTGTLVAVALAPVAVLPGWQRRGIGSDLIREGLEVCRERGKAAVIVVGDPEFYSHFGFSWELARRLRSPYSGAGRAWMALELTEDVLANVYGLVQYPEAFSLVKS